MKANFINRLIEFSNLEVTMNYNQYRSYRSNNINLLEIKMENKLDEEIGFIFRNDKKLYKLIVIAIAFAMTISLTTVTASAGGMENIDKLGNTFLNIVRRAMYWICLIKGLVDVGREVSRGGDNIGNVGKIIFKYVLAFATLYLMPWLFDLVRDSF